MWRSGWSTTTLGKSATAALVGLLVATGSTALAQTTSSIPAVPQVSSVPAAAAAAPTGFFGKCTSCIGSLGGCFKGCCNTPLGRLLNGAVKPLEMATGGVISAPCPDPNDPSKNPKNSQSQGAPGPEQAADAIKKDQAEAKARCEAVRYLATVPCHYYPEAEAALIQALRTDRSECVRWEAAHAFAQGCCCTKKTIEALKITASGSQKDGNPSELSFRVKVEALNALEHCLAMCGDADKPQRPESPALVPEPEPVPTPVPQPRRPEMPLSQDAPVAAAMGVQQVNYYAEVEKQPSEALLADARRLVDSSKLSAASAGTRRGGNSLLELWRRSDRSEDTAADPLTETAGPVRVELPSSAEDDTRRPTLAPPAPPLVPQADFAADLGPAAMQAPAQQPYADAPIDPRYLPSSSPAPGTYEPYLPSPYGSPEMPVRDEAVNNWNPLPPPYETPPSYGQWPSASRPQYPPVVPAPQALPPSGPPAAVPSTPTSSTAPAQTSTAVGQQGYYYPSTDAPVSSYYGQPAQVVQQPDWANPHPRR